MFSATLRKDGAHSRDIWSVSWTNESIVTSSLDGTAKVWNLVPDKEDPQMKAKLLKLAYTSPMQKLGITSAHVASDLGQLITCCQDSVLRFYDMADGALQEAGAIDAGVSEAHSTAMSPDQKLVAAGSVGGGLHVWGTADKTEKLRLDLQARHVLSTAFSPDCSLVAATSVDGVLTVVDLAGGRAVHRLAAHALPVRSVAFGGDGKLLLTASDDRHACLFDVRSGRAVNSFSHAGMALGVAAAPDRRHFTVACADHRVCLWDMGMQQCVQSLDTQHKEPIWSVSFQGGVAAAGTYRRGDTMRFASVGEDGALQLYES